MEQFLHLKFSKKIIGSARFIGGGSESKKTKENKENRTTHSRRLGQQATNISEE